MYALLSVEALFTIKNIGSKASVHSLIDKQKWSIHTQEYDSALKRKEILTHAIVWMNLQNVRLSEICRS